MKASVSTAMEFYDNLVLVLGDMCELGDYGNLYHEEIGDFIIEHKNPNNKIQVITVGEYASKITNRVKLQGIDAVSFSNNSDAVRYIFANIDKSSTIFLKASRAMKFEEIANGLKGEKVL